MRHAGFTIGAKVIVDYIDAERLEGRSDDEVAAILGSASGIIVPGGFGSRGTEGMMVACRYARQKKVPYLGICLGMQVAAIEFARNVCGLKGASSTELDLGTPHPVVCLMDEQRDVHDMGGTLRLGNYACRLVPGTHTAQAYGLPEGGVINERHRHRYELNNAYRQILEENGLHTAGENPDLGLVEAMELTDHPHFVAVQFHPEFRSRPTRPHPLFVSFISSASKVTTR